MRCRRDEECHAAARRFCDDAVMAKRGRRKGKYRQTTRVLMLLEHLRARRYGATLVELADEFDVTDRQIRRDLDVLAEAGHDPQLTPAADGRTRVRLPGSAGRSVTLSLRERYGLLAVRRVFDVLEGTPFHEDVRSIYSKVAASLPEEQRAGLEHFGDRFLFVPDGGTKGYAGKEEVLDALLTGVIHRLRVRHRYRAADGKTRTGRLEPYAMLLYKHGLYVIGRSLPEGDVSGEHRPFVFAAERFVEAEHLRGEHFEVPATFKIDEFFHGAFGIFVGGPPQRVAVEFSSAVRERVEARTWHRTEKRQPLPDGGVRLTFEAGNLTQVVPWILGWGAHARAIEPAALVEELSRVLREAEKRYPPTTPRER